MDNDKEYGFAWALGLVAAVVLLTGLGFYVHAVQIADTKTLGVAEANANREVYERTKAYRDGVRRDFDELRLSYLQARTPEGRAAVLSIMRHRAQGVPQELLSDDVKEMIR